MRTASAEIVAVDARRAWAERAQAWGYPRPVTESEITDGRWFANGRGVVWYTAVSPEALALLPALDGALTVHGISDPTQLGQALTADTVRDIEDTARDLGARKLYSVIPLGAPGLPVKAMRRYLRRFGWLEDELGSFKLLEG